MRQACVQATSMQQVIGHGSPGSAASSNRAATAAWNIFDPMQFGMHAHTDAPTTAEHGLAESIAMAMCEMTGPAEMAMLWSEVRCA